jgi:4-alpha-glucanotransferase
MTTHTLFVPSDSIEDALSRAGALWGIEPEYWDIFGHHHVTPPSVTQAILRSRGVAADTREQLDHAVEEMLWSRWSHPVGPVIVLGEHDDKVEVALPFHVGGRLRLVFFWESGESEWYEIDPNGCPVSKTAELRGARFEARNVPLPAKLPLGYHDLTVEAVAGYSFPPAKCRFIVGPDRAWCPPEYAGNHRRAAGITVSLYGVRSARNWGCGDATDLIALLDWLASDVQGSFLGLNPLHAIHNRTPYNTSPYLPNCTLYRNFIYIDPEKTEEFATSPGAERIHGSENFQKQLEQLRASQFVEYEKVARLKLRFLKLLFRTFLRRWRKGDAEPFRVWAQEEGLALHRYATYCALDETLHKENRDLWLWTNWPEEYRNPESAASEAFERKHWRLILFYKWLQWLLDLQFAAAQQHAQERKLTVGLYHDLALATDRYGSDLWANRKLYVHGCRVGSPPDDFSPNGQDWSFPPPNSQAHREDGYRQFVESIRKTCRHGGALRIDHVMRFFRLFWIPEGLTASQGAYVRDNPEELLRILALESVRQKVVVIGEDLGTVEPSFRETLARFGILSYRLLYFEKRPDGGFKLPHEYPRQSLVSVTTHDLPTIGGFWAGRDIESRLAAGIVDRSGYELQKRDRAVEKQRLMDTLFDLNLLPPHVSRDARTIPELTGELHNAIVGYLAMTPSIFLALNQEDLTKEIEQQNLPGTTAQYPNWRRKMRYTVEELTSLKAPRDCAAMFQHWLARTNRVNG